MAAMEVLQIKIYKFYGKKEIKKLMMNKKENIHMFWNNWILDIKFYDQCRLAMGSQLQTA